MTANEYTNRIVEASANGEHEKVLAYWGEVMGYNPVTMQYESELSIEDIVIVHQGVHSAVATANKVVS